MYAFQSNFDQYSIFIPKVGRYITAIINGDEMMIKNLNLEKENIRNKLHELLAIKRIAIQRLASHFCVPEKWIFRCHMTLTVPFTGVMPDGTRFYFHGLGCTITNKNEGWTTDLEFGFYGETELFNKYTLCILFGLTIDDCDQFIDFLESNGLVKLADENLVDESTRKIYRALWEGDIENLPKEKYMVIE